MIDPYELAKAQALLTGYHLRWAAEVIEVLGVEVEFRTPLVNPETNHPSKTYALGGKIDAVARLADGRLAIVEHKTSSEDIAPGSDYWKRLRLDGQVSVYFDGARALGHDVEVCLYDVIGKPGQKPLKATPEESRKYVAKTGLLYANQRASDETPAEYKARIMESIAEDPTGYYARGEVVRLETDMDDARADVWQQAATIRESARTGKAPRNPDSCMRYNRMCSFWPVCTREASLDNPAQYRKTSGVHEELGAVVGLPLLTSSRLKSARACQRLHHLEYVEGYRPVSVADTLRFGTLMHNGLEAWWRASGDARLDAALGALEGATTVDEVPHAGAA